MGEAHLGARTGVPQDALPTSLGGGGVQSIANRGGTHRSETRNRPKHNSGIQGARVLGQRTPPEPAGSVYTSSAGRATKGNIEAKNTREKQGEQPKWVATTKPRQWMEGDPREASQESRRSQNQSNASRGGAAQQ
ncbi:unnamed protein product [Calypogeia fissa]